MSIVNYYFMMKVANQNRSLWMVEKKYCNTMHMCTIIRGLRISLRISTTWLALRRQAIWLKE